ncbi:hypothetical protein M23134_04354 [Microscilla marina ATCC 23134]|uniref:Uncharacterized protein n=1 Tax=Microscilla marina ATCC 23134 TaxID=313606 RepID=A1ZLX5_MICM2|nr:hypothetical protein M23134_04354 [Microscilla marina ATCC 23134]
MLKLQTYANKSNAKMLKYTIHKRILLFKWAIFSSMVKLLKNGVIA